MEDAVDDLALGWRRSEPLHVKDWPRTMHGIGTPYMLVDMLLLLESAGSSFPGPRSLAGGLASETVKAFPTMEPHYG